MTMMIVFLLYTNYLTRVIPDFLCGLNKIFVGLACYVAMIGSYLATFLYDLSIPYSKVS